MREIMSRIVQKSGTIALILSIGVFMPLTAKESIIRFHGSAYDLSTGKLVYEDHHEEHWENGKHMYSMISYKDANGKVFAHKKIDFSKNPILPVFALEDSRFGYQEGGRPVKGGVRVYTQANRNSARKETFLPIKGNAALDGGFDYLVQSLWDGLASGKSYRLQLFLPPRQDFFWFKAYKTKIGDYNGRKSLFLEMKLDMMFVSLFLPKIYLVYDFETKRIMEFRGVSNIDDGTGKDNYKVKIVYKIR